MTVTDDEGRTVTIPAEPRRILSLAPSNTEILFALGLGDRVVGVDNFSDYPPEAASLPRVGDLMNPNYEAMAALSPDLALAIGGSEEFWQKLEELGVPVVVIQPNTVAEVIDSIRLVGRVTGAAEAADALARSMADRVEAVQHQAARLSHRPRVFWEVWDDPLMSAGPGSFFDDMIRLAGGVNVVGDAESPWPQVSPEAVIARDPEVIITTQAEWAERLRSGALPAWSGTTAVRQGRIYVVEDNLVSRPGPRIVEGLEQVARAIQSQGAGR
ncbi:MAG: cobalamin-binding protein [Bacillota bacterium]